MLYECQVYLLVNFVPRLVVIEVDEVSKGFGERLLMDNLSFKVPPGAIVGIIGANGAGKTTLFRMLMGEAEPDSGNIRMGRIFGWIRYY